MTDINNFEKKYRGSEEEVQDLINFYNQKNGDIRYILQSIPLSRNRDVKRFLEIYEKLFKKKILKRNDKYEKTKDKIICFRKNKEEEKEAKEILEKLTKQIELKKNKKRNFNDYLTNLAKININDKIDKVYDEINEKDFQKIVGNLKKKEKMKK